MDVSDWTVTTTACCKAMRFSSLRNMSSNRQPKVRTCCGYTHFLRFCCTGLIAELEPRILTSSATCEQQQAAIERITSLLHEPLKVSLVVLMVHLKSMPVGRCSTRHRALLSGMQYCGVRWVICTALPLWDLSTAWRPFPEPSFRRHTMATGDQRILAVS